MLVWLKTPKNLNRHVLRRDAEHRGSRIGKAESIDTGRHGLHGCSRALARFDRDIEPRLPVIAVRDRQHVGCIIAVEFEIGAQHDFGLRQREGVACADDGARDERHDGDAEKNAPCHHVCLVRGGWSSAPSPREECQVPSRCEPVLAPTSAGLPRTLSRGLFGSKSLAADRRVPGCATSCLRPCQCEPRGQVAEGPLRLCATAGDRPATP